MRRMTLALLALLCARSADAQKREGAQYGSSVIVTVRGVQAEPAELLAVSTDSIWVRDGFFARGIALQDIERITVDRKVSGVGSGFVRMALFGTLTGVGLAVACGKTGGDGCSAVVPVSVLMSLTVALIAAPSLDRARHPPLLATPDSIRPWARFPQGFPTGVPRDSITRGRVRPPH